MQKLFLGLSASALMAATPAIAQSEFTLNILHINDFHSRFESITSSDSNCDAEGEAAGECFGGIARLKTAIDQRRGELEGAGENVILLSAGDQFQGSLFYTQYKSAIVSQFMNEMGFDVVGVGNHEFDDGPAELAKFISDATFPIVGGNFNVAREPELAGKLTGVHVLDVGGEQVGIIGTLTEDTPEIAAPGPNVVFGDVETYVRGAVEALEAQGINKIIVLSHIGHPDDQALAAAVDGIDLIVGGHTHTLLSNVAENAAGPYPTMVASPSGVEVPIVTAHQYGRYLGDVKVTWNDAGVVTEATGEPILLDASVQPDEAFLAQVAEAAGPIEELKAQVVGTATAPIEGSREVCRTAECAMGNLVAEAMLDRVADQGITIAIQNGGGVRASIDAGEITMGEVLTVLPFSNTLSTFQIKGSDVLAALENGLSQVEEGAGRFPQVAGLRYSWSPAREPGTRVITVEVMENGQWGPLDPNKTYGVVTNNYVRTGGDGYAMFNTNAIDPYDFGPPLEQVLADYIAERGGEYAPQTDGRITQVQ